MRGRILIADDERDNYEQISWGLNEHKLTYEGIYENIEATARNGKFDVILLDLYWKTPDISLDDARERGMALIPKVIGKAPRVILWTSAPEIVIRPLVEPLGITEIIGKDWEDDDKLKKALGYQVD